MASAFSLRTHFSAPKQSIGSWISLRNRSRSTSLPLADLSHARSKRLPPESLVASPSLLRLRKGPFLCAVHGNGGVGGEEEEEGAVAVAVAAARAEEENAKEIVELKLALEASILSTEHGVQGNEEIQSEIMELITQLEAQNPHPNALEFLDLLDGKWILRYTSLSEFLPLLAAKSLPLIKVGEISQSINSTESIMVNSVTFIGPVGTTTLSAKASFEVCSPKRLQMKFEEGIIGAPQLKDTLNLPESFTFLGQKVDLTAFQGIFQTLQSATISITRTISGQPPLKFPIKNERVQPWLLTTYLDHDLRIARGDNGSVFVYVKNVSQLLE